MQQQSVLFKMTGPLCNGKRRMGWTTLVAVEVGEGGISGIKNSGSKIHVIQLHLYHHCPCQVAGFHHSKCHHQYFKWAVPGTFMVALERLGMKKRKGIK